MKKTIQVIEGDSLTEYEGKSFEEILNQAPIRSELYIVWYKDNGFGWEFSSKTLIGKASEITKDDYFIAYDK